MPGQGEGMRVPEISIIYEKLLRSIDIMDKRVAEMEARIQQVIPIPSSPPPMAMLSSPTPPTPEAKTPLGSKLADCTRRIDEIGDRLSILANSIEL